MAFNKDKVINEFKKFIAGAKTGDKHTKPDGTVVDSHDPVANAITEGARQSPQTAMRLILGLAVALVVAIAFAVLC